MVHTRNLQFNSALIKRLGSVLLVLAAAGVLLFWYRYSLPASPKIASLLPDSTVLLLSVPDFVHTRTAVTGTDAYQLFQEPQVQTLAAELNQAIFETLGAKKTKASESPQFPIFDVAEGETFLALTDLGAQSIYTSRIVCGVDVKQKYLETRIAIAYREFRIRTWNREATFTTKTHLGMRYRVWTFSKSLRLYHTFFHSLLVFTNDEDALRNCIARFTSHSPRANLSLADSPRFQEHLRHLRVNPELITYLNLDPLADRWPALRFLSTDTAGLGATILRNQIRDIGYLTHSAPHPAAPLLSRQQTIVMTTPNTAYYRVGATDWETGYRNFAEAVVKSENRNLLLPTAHFEQILENNGIRPRQDLFHFLGPETALIVNWRLGARFPDIALAMELRNPEQTRLRLDVAMTAIKDALSPPKDVLPWDISHFRDETLRTARLRTSRLAPTYFITDKFLVITSTPDFARELIEQIKELVPTLAMNANYQQAMHRLPTNACAYTYCDLPSIVPPLLAHLRDGLQLRPSRFINKDKLPNPETLTRHLSPFASATVAGTRDETTVTISTLGKPVTSILGALAVYFIARPYLQISSTGPTTSSSTPALPPPSENQTATSPAPPTR